jgi:hypothetical protein
LNDEERKRISFPLRLGFSLKQRAELLASQDGVSLNHFISLAVAEKIAVLAQGALLRQQGHTKNPQRRRERACNAKWKEGSVPIP